MVASGDRSARQWLAASESEKEKDRERKREGNGQWTNDDDDDYEWSKQQNSWLGALPSGQWSAHRRRLCMECPYYFLRFGFGESLSPHSFLSLWLVPLACSADSSQTHTLNRLDVMLLAAPGSLSPIGLYQFIYPLSRTKLSLLVLFVYQIYRSHCHRLV